MSQLDLLTQLRDARPVAPAEVRERIREIAAQAKEPKRPRFQLDWRRGLFVAGPVLAAAVAAIVLLPSSGTTSQREAAIGTIQPTDTIATELTPPLLPAKKVEGYAASPTTGGALASSAQASDGALPSTIAGRTQKISASLELRLPDAQALSEASKRAVAIARALGGFPRSYNVNTGEKDGSASIVFRIPKQNVQKAVARLSTLGTVIGQNVAIQDLQAQVDATGKKIARLKTRLAYWQNQYQTTETQKHIASLTAAIAKAQRGRSSTVAAASYATVNLQLSTPEGTVVPKGHGPFHKLSVIFNRAGIVSVYVLALGAPLLLVGLAGLWFARRARRRSEERLLAAP